MKREALNSNSWRELVQRTMLEKDISYEEALEYVKQKFPEIVDEVGIDTLVNMDAPKDQQYVDVLDLPETETVLYSKNSDLQGLSNDTIEELEFQGIAKQIVNKWLCQALDKNNGAMVRNACIVLQTLERKATFWKGDDFITLNFNVIEKNDNPVYDPENLDDEDPLFYSKVNDAIKSKFSEIIQSDYDSADSLTGGYAEGLLLSYDLLKDTPKERVEEIKEGILNELKSNPKFKVVKYY